MNKIYITFTLFLILQFNSFGQVVNESVSFDNYTSYTDNDLKNHFDFGTFTDTSFIHQITTNGITGGSLSPGQSIDQWNDVLNYCSKFENELNQVNSVSISFKEDTSLVNPNSNLDGVLLLVSPKQDWNHYIGASVKKNKIKMTTLLNGAPSKTIPTLQTDNWYNLKLTTTILGGTFGDKIQVDIELFNIGANGMGSPLLVDSIQRIIYDDTFASDTSVTVSLSGSTWGGAKFIDDFTFQGLKNSYSCSSTNQVDELTEDLKLQIYPNPTCDQFFIETNSTDKLNIELYDLNGRQVYSAIVSNKSTINVATLDEGIYTMIVKSIDHVTNKKLVIVR